MSAVFQIDLAEEDFLLDRADPVAVRNHHEWRIYQQTGEVPQGSWFGNWHFGNALRRALIAFNHAHKDRTDLHWEAWQKHDGRKFTIRAEVLPSRERRG